MARIHIMSYIYELHAQSPVFCGVTHESPIVGVDPSQMSHAVFGEIQHLRDCISALFQFVRKPTEDEDFFNDVNIWLENLVCFGYYFIVFSLSCSFFSSLPVVESIDCA